jgi:hypothetical protein
LGEGEEIRGVEQGNIGEDYAVAIYLTPAFEGEVSTNSRVDLNPKYVPVGLAETIAV